MKNKENMSQLISRRAFLFKQAQLRLCKLGPGTVLTCYVVFISKVVFIFEVVFMFDVIFMLEVVFIFEGILIFYKSLTPTPLYM